MIVTLLGIPFRLSLKSEEFMTYYAKLLDENFARKTKFIKNFFKDWRSVSLFFNVILFRFLSLVGDNISVSSSGLINQLKIFVSDLV